MSLIKHYQILEYELKSKPFEEGALYVTTDTNRIFADFSGGGSHTLISASPIIISTEIERENLLAPINDKLYFVLQTSKLYLYNAGNWYTLTYTHPSYTTKQSGLYKISVDGTGHVNGATVVSKSDITSLGIPGTVDSELSHTSTNPIQNRTVYEAINSNGIDIEIDESDYEEGNGLNADTLGGFSADSYVRHNDSKFSNIAPKAGFIYPLANAIVPEGFLLCDGSEYSRNEYPELFAAIGTIYGSGDGSNTFNVPNLQTRVPIGMGEDYELGSIGGEAEHKLTIGEMAHHTHTDRINWVEGSMNTLGVGSTPLGLMSVFGNVGVDRGGITGGVGSDQPHNNMQPYTVVNYIIATGKNTGVSVRDIILGAQALPIGIEYGGTGATNAKDSRQNLGITPENIGAMSMKLLWENASPKSNFNAQTILLANNDAKEVYIDFYDKENRSNGTIKMELGGLGAISIVGGINGVQIGKMVYFSRFVTASTQTTITFNDSKYADADGTPYENRNNNLIPRKVYYFKGEN